MLTATGEACKKAEEENSQLAEEKLALIIELGAVKDDFTAFREKAATEKEMMEAAFDSSGDTIFNYGYGCCAFTHNICGSKPEIPNGMLNPSVPLTADFFANPRCPPGAYVPTSSLDLVVVTPQKYPIIFIIKFILYSEYNWANLGIIFFIYGIFR